MVSANAMTVNVKNVSIRYANLGDIDHLEEIDVLPNWKEILLDKQQGLIVLEYKKVVCGVYSFRLTKTTYLVDNFMVNLKFRHMRMGSRLIDDLKDRCYKTSHKLINIKTPEYAVDLQLFLKYHGFWAISLDKSGHGWYNMVYRV